MLLYSLQHVVDGGDFSELSGLNSTFTIGSSNGDMVCIDVTIFDDDTLEGDEDFTVEIDSVVDASGGGGVVLIGLPSQGSVTILDSEGKVLYKVRIDCFIL